MRICVWALGLRTRGHKPNQHEGGPFNATGDKVVAEGCSGARGGGQGGSLALRGLLVQPAALLFRFPSQCQGPGIDV